MEAGDLGGVDERLGLFRHEAAEPNRKSIREEVGEPVERSIVVVGGLAASPRRGAKRDWRLGSQTPLSMRFAIEGYPSTGAHRHRCSGAR